jgi:DNA-binding NarL/FixJ family response regulator
VTRIRVLVADDHPLVRSGLVATFAAEEDLEVVAQAASGREAVELFRRHRPDVALIDLRMPGLDGADAAARICAEFPGARVVMLSSFDGDEDIHRAFAAGAVTYVLKETSPGDLVAIVRAVHGGRPPVPAEVRAALEAHEAQEALTAREREILRLMARGLANRAIAERLAVTENTVRFHLKSIFGKLGVDDRTAAVVTALSRGIIRLE